MIIVASIHRSRERISFGCHGFNDLEQVNNLGWIDLDLNQSIFRIKKKAKTSLEINKSDANFALLVKKWQFCCSKSIKLVNN